MKPFIYMCVLAVAIMLPVSERVRSVVFEIASITLSSVGQIVTGQGTAEVRVVGDSEFDKTINEPGRLVIVDFHHEETMLNRSEKAELENAINHLPSKVLVAQVIAGRNIELLNRLKIRNIPTLQIYRDGELLEEFPGKVDQEQFMKVAQYHLDHPDSKPFQDGYIGPSKKDWLPEGVKPMPSSGKVTPLDFGSE